MSAEFTYQTIKIKDLPGFTDDFFANTSGQEMTPISPQRAKSHSENPFASDDDPGLFVAYDGKKVVGYLGILPDQLTNPDGDGKFFLASSLLVSPNYRGKKIAFNCQDAVRLALTEIKPH